MVQYLRLLTSGPGSWLQSLSETYDPTCHLVRGKKTKKTKKKKKQQRIMLYLTADVILDLMEISIFHKQNPTY